MGLVGKDEGTWGLVAADDSEFWFSLRREVPELDKRLLTVRTGRDCLRAIEDRRIRLVVLDCSLSDVSSTHLAHLVRQLRQDVGIVLTFSVSTQEQEKEARQAGILYYGDREGIKEIARVVRKTLTPRTARSKANTNAGNPLPEAVKGPMDRPGAGGAGPV